MRRALRLLGHLIAMIGLVWLLALAVVLIGLPIVAIVRVVAAAIKCGSG
jgi:hypothetical protein